MKQFFRVLPVLALVAGLAGSAFTSRVVVSKEKPLVNYDFIRISDSATYSGTRSAAKTNLGCPLDNGTACAQAYTAGHSGDASYRQSDQDIYKAAK